MSDILVNARRTVRRRLGHIHAAAGVVLLLAGCGDGQEAAPTAGRPVSMVTVEAGKLASDVRLSGEIQAEVNVAIAFRIGGKVSELTVNVGDQVGAGQVIARLDSTIERNTLAAAKAALEAARGEVETTRNAYERQERLLAQGFTTRPRYDQALQAQEAAQALFEDAEVQVELAQDRLGFTELRSDIAGVVTARTVETGEVVQAGQVVVDVARDDGRDAVFNVPARLIENHEGDGVILVALADAPDVTAYGRIREVSPQADPVTRTFQVRVGLQDPPDAMQLGSTIVGTMETESAAIISIPASALTQSGVSPAVWLFDPSTSVVSLRNVDILRFDPNTVILSQGLEPGDIIVSGGIQALHPGQRVVRLPDAAPG
jgi:RND family efflux transporter MFP subunit